MDRNKSPYLDPQMARYYAEASAPNQFDQPARDLVEYLKISTGKRILDIGSGSGLIATAAADMTGVSGSVFAVDSSIEMLRQQRTDRVIRVVAHAQNLPFGNEIFDRIAAGFVITHLPDYGKGLSEWVRVLRSRGILVASAWAAGATKVSDTWKSTIKQYVELTTVEKTFAQVIPSDEFFCNRDNLANAFERSGLIDVHAETKSYLMSMTVRQYTDSKIGSVEGTIVRNCLGQKGWDLLLAELIRNLQKEFPQQIEYERNVHFVSGKKR